MFLPTDWRLSAFIHCQYPLGNQHGNIGICIRLFMILHIIFSILLKNLRSLKWRASTLSYWKQFALTLLVTWLTCDWEEICCQTSWLLQYLRINNNALFTGVQIFLLWYGKLLSAPWDKKWLGKRKKMKKVQLFPEHLSSNVHTAYLQPQLTWKSNCFLSCYAWYKNNLLFWNIPGVAQSLLLAFLRSQYWQGWGDQMWFGG